MIKPTALLQRLVFSFFLVSFFLFLFSIRPVSAQTPNPYTAPNTNPDVPKNLHTWSQNVMIEVMSAMACQITGIDPTNPNQACLGVDQKTGKIGFVEGGGGAIGVVSNMIAMTFTPPIHTNEYVKYLAQNFGIAKPAYAQTSFDRLRPFMNIWIAFRNIVYLLFVLVFVVVGLAIMLRVKIDPRTVMTIENQIPKIIVGLLLVTFSFAIVGFLIDIMYIFIYLVFNIFNGIIQDKNLIPDTQKSFNGENAFQVFNNLVRFIDVVTSSAGGVKDIVQNLFGTSASFDTSGARQWWDVLGALKDFAIDVVKNALGAVLGWLAGTLALLIIGIAVLWAMFRLWFQLITAYVFILLDIIFAPFWIVAGLIPGSPVSFSAWLRDILANLAAFPVTITMFLLGRVFMDALKTDQNAFVPPLIGNPGQAGAFSSLIGLGMILLTPSVVSMTKAAFKAPKFNLAPIAQAIGVGAGAVNLPSHMQKLGQFGYYSKYWREPGTPTAWLLGKVGLGKKG